MTKDVVSFSDNFIRFPLFCQLTVGYKLPRALVKDSAQFRLTSQTRFSLAFIVYFLFYDKNSDIMSSTRAVESNTFGDNARIHQGDVIHNYASNPHKPCVLIPFPRNEELIPRQDLISELDRILPLSEEYSTAALYGLGGSG